jgi:hypothetical protein
MNALLLALHLTVTNGVAEVRFNPPPTGWWIVWAMEDSVHWRAVKSGPGFMGAHATVKDKCNGTCKIYRVEWRP